MHKELRKVDFCLNNFLIIKILHLCDNVVFLFKYFFHSYLFNLF